MNLLHHPWWALASLTAFTIAMWGFSLGLLHFVRVMRLDPNAPAQDLRPSPFAWSKAFAILGCGSGFALGVYLWMLAAHDTLPIDSSIVGALGFIMMATWGLVFAIIAMLWLGEPDWRPVNEPPTGYPIFPVH